MLSPEDQANVEVLAQLMRDEERGLRVSAPILLGPYSAYLLVCGLQLAWRHPDPPPEIRGMWREAGEAIASTLPADAQKLMATGWDPSQDVINTETRPC